VKGRADHHRTLSHTIGLIAYSRRAQQKKCETDIRAKGQGRSDICALTLLGRCEKDELKPRYVPHFSSRKK
jgi:hypothetical protein